jgi:putative acetyltransferase
MAVHPAHQHLGVGGALIHMSLPMLAHQGVQAVVVLGHPEYYPRFGFSAGLAASLNTPFPGPHLMAMELEPGSIEGLHARPRYARAFRL